jgi:methionyl-tRNA formyltransferase
VASPASYAPKLRKEELIIDWAKDARTIANLIRALSPSPLARTSFRGDMVAIQAARPLSLTPEAPAGTILSDKGPLIVAAAKGVLELLSLKPMGRRLMSGADFRNGYRPSAGERFGR